MYASKKVENIQSNYEFVSATNNTSGHMTKETIEVIYYYKIKDAEIITNEVSKAGSNKLTKEGEKVTYNLIYRGEIAQYIGNATVTIVDKLPYEIDEVKSNLMRCI